uniref:Uncharacterized protein n=1 Tax=viral metagenome TaxID=1070528 RepID=A0A6M3K006_9ZZZZ
MKSGNNEQHIPFTRKKPKIEYEEPPVIAMPDVDVKLPEPTPRTEPTQHHIQHEREPKDLGILTWDTIQDPHITGPENELAERYKPPPVIHPPEAPPVEIPELPASEPTTFTVSEPEKKPKTLDEETKRLWRT